MAFCALNQDSLFDTSFFNQTSSPVVSPKRHVRPSPKGFSVTSEAKETSLCNLYQLALKNVQENRIENAVEFWQKILSDPDVQSLCDNPARCKGLRLDKVIYSSLKNVGKYEIERGNTKTGVNHYLTACRLDDTDVSLWFAIGKACEKYFDLNLARKVYEQALSCNEKHWPSLDRLITVLYATNDYINCLAYISIGIDRRQWYNKGHILRKQIFKEEPSFQFELDINNLYFLSGFSPEEESAVLNECLALRKGFADAERLPVICAAILECDTTPTWVSLGEKLLAYVSKVESNPDTNLYVSLQLWNPSDSKQTAVTSTEIIESEVESLLHALVTDVVNNLVNKLGSKTSTTNRRKQNSLPSTPVEEPDMGVKRRSVRVRIIKEKKVENVTLEQQLCDILPQFLLQKPDTERISLKRQSSSDKPVEKDFTEEISAIVLNTGLDKMCLIKSVQIYRLLLHYLYNLTQHTDKKWPAELIELYEKIFQIVKPTLMCTYDFSDSHLYEFNNMIGWVYLVNIEFSMNQKPKESFVHNSELCYCMEIAGYPEIFGSRAVDFITRVYRLLALSAQRDGNIPDATEYLDNLATVLKDNPGHSNVIANIDALKMIDKRNVDLYLTELRERLSIEQVDKLYSKGCYEDVLKLLLDMVQKRNHDLLKMEKHTDYVVMVQQCFTKLGRIDEAIEHTWIYLSEIMESFGGNSSQSTSPADNPSASVLCKLFHNLAQLFSTINLELLSDKDLKLVSNVSLAALQKVCLSEEEQSRVTLVDPWICLYFVTTAYENRLSLKKQRELGKTDDSNSSTSSSEEEEVLSAGLRLLVFAHERLSTSNSCTMCNGDLLLFFTKQLSKSLNTCKSQSLERKLRFQLDHCFYCLFGYPRRFKSDHNAVKINLLWEHCLLLYELYRPENFPTYDSVKFSSITAECEHLFRRIAVLIPEKLLSKCVSNAEIFDYLNSNTDEPPKQLKHVDAETNSELENHLIEAIYYLLADYYLKTQEPECASRFYVKDLCVKPERFDSWAGLALAKMAIVENRLESLTRPLSFDIITLGKVTLRCFERALELQKATKLCLERGSLAYQLHTLSIHILQKDENDEVASKARNDMLFIAEQSYGKVLDGDIIVDDADSDDDVLSDIWVAHYMLGKVAEKRYDSLSSGLKHYTKAAENIHESGAKYPKRIKYELVPPKLAIEALEMYFRIHALITKRLLKFKESISDADLDVAQQAIWAAAKSPFVLCLEQEQKLDSFCKRKRDLCLPSQNRDAGTGDPEIRKALNDILDRISNDRSPDRYLNSSLSSGGFDSEHKPNSDGLEKSLPFQRDFVTERQIDSPKERLRISILRSCLSAFALCINRFPHHYKSHYLMALIYHKTPSVRGNVKTAKNILLGSIEKLPFQLQSGLFQERKPTNFFNGLWRIPSQDVDRSGSFPRHLYRAALLLIDILTNLSDMSGLLMMYQALSSKPEHGKMYLHEVNRKRICNFLLEQCLHLSNEKVMSAARVSRQCLLDIYQFHNLTTKHKEYSDIVKSYLDTAANSYAGKPVDSLQFCIRMLNSSPVFLNKPSSNRQRNIMEASSIPGAISGVLPTFVTVSASTPSAGVTNLRLSPSSSGLSKPRAKTISFISKSPEARKRTEAFVALKGQRKSTPHRVTEPRGRTLSTSTDSFLLDLPLSSNLDISSADSEISPVKDASFCSDSSVIFLDSEDTDDQLSQASDLDRPTLPSSVPITPPTSSNVPLIVRPSTTKPIPLGYAHPLSLERKGDTNRSSRPIKLVTISRPVTLQPPTSKSKEISSCSVLPLSHSVLEHHELSTSKPVFTPNISVSSHKPHIQMSPSRLVKDIKIAASAQKLSSSAKSTLNIPVYSIKHKSTATVHSPSGNLVYSTIPPSNIKMLEQKSTREKGHTSSKPEETIIDLTSDDD